MLVSSPMTSGTPCLAARAARYFLLISPKGCSTKLIFTPGCDCSKSGITVSIDTLSKYHTVSSVSGALSAADTGTDVADVVVESVPGVDDDGCRLAGGATLSPHA